MNIDISISLEDSTPIYLQIVDGIKENIAKKVWESGQQLPSEEDFVKALDVSRGTFRKAVNILVDEKILVKIHGKGTFVSEDKISLPIAQRLLSYAESMDEKGYTFRTEVLNVEIVLPNLEIQSKLQITENTKVIFLKRVRYVNDEPAILLYNWIVESLVPGIANEDFTNKSLFKILEERMNMKIEYGLRDFSAKIPTKEQAELLSLSEGEPALCVNQITFSKGNTPIECSDVYLRTDKYQITSVLVR